jgi:hypothetical protein
MVATRSRQTIRIGGPWSRGGSTDHMQNANIWANFDNDYRQTVIQQYHTAGIALMVSAFGSTGECFSVTRPLCHRGVVIIRALASNGVHKVRYRWLLRIGTDAFKIRQLVLGRTQKIPLGDWHSM